MSLRGYGQIMGSIISSELSKMLKSELLLQAPFPGLWWGLPDNAFASLKAGVLKVFPQNLKKA